MSVKDRAFKGASWLALFKALSQVFSWCVTVLIARILVPDDYGLMSMATILTGYASLFSELGLGSAIIQKQNLTSEDKELSSVFWFTFVLGLFFAALCFVFAYPTAYIFNDSRVTPITQTVSIIFIVNGLMIVPFNLLKKDLNFKKVGFIEMIGVLVSGTCMIIIAKHGGGVWTLIWGHIIRNIIKMLLTYYYAKWIPELHFNLNEAKSFLKFGTRVAAGESMFYLYTKSGTYFAGRAWNAELLGYYSLALQLSTIPTEKIITLINQVSYSALSLLQNDKNKFNEFYLNTVKITAIISMPLFVLGYFLGEDLIRLLLGEKWLPIIFVFKYLCLAQIIVAINAVNNFVHNALGNPHWSLRFNMICVAIIPVSFYMAVKISFEAIVIPWLTTYFLIYSGWIIFTIRKLGISISAYLKNLYSAILSTILMVLTLVILENTILVRSFVMDSLILKLAIEITVCGLSYIWFIYIFDRNILIKIKNLSKK